jgi:hypothetical protein
MREPRHMPLFRADYYQTPTSAAKHRLGLRAFDCNAAYLQAELKKAIVCQATKRANERTAKGDGRSARY